MIVKGEEFFFYVEAKNKRFFRNPALSTTQFHFKGIYIKKIKNITVYYHVFSKNKLKSFSRKRKKKREKSSIHDSSVYGVALSI